LWKELNGLQIGYPSLADAHPMVGYPVPDFDLLLTDGSSVRLYELLHGGEMVVLDLSGAGALQGLFSLERSVRIVQAHAARMPKSPSGKFGFMTRGLQQVA
jgi:hypothetical protein